MKAHPSTSLNLFLIRNEAEDEMAMALEIQQLSSIPHIIVNLSMPGKTLTEYNRFDLTPVNVNCLNLIRLCK